MTLDQQQSIANYKRFSIDIELLEDDLVKITQSRLINGYILNQKQLHERAREIFPTPEIKIIPVVYILQVNDINLEWIIQQMEMYRIKRNDLIKQLAFNKDTLSLIFSGKKALTHTEKAAFYYYFLCYQLNHNFRNDTNFE